MNLVQEHRSRMPEVRFCTPCSGYLYSELQMQVPLGLQPVAGPTREWTLKTAIRGFITAHSVEDFDPYPALDDLLNGLNEGEM